MFKYLLLSMILIFSVIQSGCVGTIEDVSKQTTDSTIVKRAVLSFAGIGKAVATAHNRVRVSFFPATGGSGQFSYLVYANGNFALPVASLSSASAAVDSYGLYNIDVKNLQLNTAYNFSVRVYDIVNDEYDNNVVSYSARTLSDMVPIFDGAVALNNLPGVNGLTNLILSWNVATAAYVDTSGFGVNVHDISGYNIYAGESEASMTLVGSVSDATAKTFTISNLVSGRNYFAMVRARNSATPPLEDKNVTVVSKKTLVAQPIQFAGLKTIAIPKTIEGFSNINLTWDAGSGTFDRYKIMVFTSNPGVIIPATATPLQTTVITDLSAVNATITVPTPNTTYYVAVVACAADACLDYGGASVVKSIKTTPPIAPFNGIKSISALDLHSVQLTWDKPDATQGVYSAMKVFKSDASGVYSELTDEITADPNGTGLLLDSATDTSVVIKNLATDTEYCFVAMDYDTYYYTVDYPLGRTGTLRVRSCITVRYTPPGFLGVNTTCSAPNATGVTVTWNAPSPFGIFDYYEIYVKEGNSGFNFADAIAGDASYTKVPPVVKTATSFTFDLNSSVKLSADTYYQIGVKTYYDDNGTYRRDTNNAFTMNCKTSAATVEHKGWYEVMSIGPKVNGIKAGLANGVVSASTVIPERLKPRSTPVDGYSEIRDLEYAQEYPTGSLGIDSSNQGIIKLMWYDFQLSNGLGYLYDYAVSHPATTVEYRVYRKAHAAKYDTDYALKAKVNDTDWGSPINSTTINPQSTTLPNGNTLNFAEFIDYTLTHPYSSDSTKANEGAIFYYKVEAYVANKKVEFLGTYADSVIRVVLPPVNMAFAHRWMLNKAMCGDIGKTVETGDVDREDNYRCLYNGLGSTYDSTASAYYADMKGDLLIDRFKIGCNFSRGSSANACTDVSFNKTTAPKSFFEGAEDSTAKLKKTGDCIGWSGTSGYTPNTRVKAIPGSIFYDRANRGCYINTTAAGSLDTSGKGTAWQLLTSIDTSETTAEGSSKILPNTISLVGLGYGSLISTNNAYMPVLSSANQNNFYRTCQSNTVNINGVNFRKRLLRRKEEVATFAMPTFISPANVRKVNYGTLMNRDCASNTITSLSSPTLATDLDLSLVNYPAVHSTGSSVYQTMVTGSGGTNSTEACFSVFGLQDISGNLNEILSDRVYCSSNTLCSSGLKGSSAVTNPATPDASLNVSLIYVPEIDPDNKYNLKSGNGHYVNFALTTVAESNGPTLWPSTTSTTYLSVPPSSYKYFNPILGLMLTCQGSSCIKDGTYDDNTLVTTLSSNSNNVAHILSFPYVGDVVTSTASGAIGTVLPFVLNGYSTETTRNGRHSLAIRNFYDQGTTVNTSARCSTLIENYKDQAAQYNH
jgi:hypothetical protein